MERLPCGLTRVARTIGWLLTGPHDSGYHSNHFSHPFDRELYDIPQDEPTIEFKPAELFHLLNDDDIIAAYLEAKA